jgi:AcrR family transcriptional regulator
MQRHMSRPASTRALTPRSSRAARARGKRSRSEASAESSRERILRGATEEFASAGFAGARIDRIARKTTFNVRMIYYHFGSKRGLYRAVLESIYEQAARLLDTSERDANPATAALGLYFDLLSENPWFADVLVRELLDGARHLRVLFQARPDLFRQVHVHARELVESGQRKGVLRDEDPALTVFTLTGMVCYLTAVRETTGFLLDPNGRPPSPDKLKAHLFSVVLDGLRRR